MMSIVRHPEHDPLEFASLMDYHRHTSLNGYYGGLRLLQAACKRSLQAKHQKVGTRRPMEPAGKTPE